MIIKVYMVVIGFLTGRTDNLNNKCKVTYEFTEVLPFQIQLIQ
jgi:hypothetical protein